MQASENRHLLFVLGMHRSGTSALCAALQACGASFGSHLLAPMDGVNDEGFWEDADVVELNEELLRIAGCEWYSIAPTLLEQDWRGPEFAAQRERGLAILQRGFGDAAVEAVKDPRLCHTLPFWLDLCREAGLASSACTIYRAPIEVAESLQRRDGFPLGYGLRLYHAYAAAIAAHAAEAGFIGFEQLLDEPLAALPLLLAGLPLELDDTRLRAAVREDLRHCRGSAQESSMAAIKTVPPDLPALELAIEQSYPLAQTLAELVDSMVERGLELTRIGDSHSVALATLDERGADIDKLGAELQQALDTIAERDQQIRDLDKRLAETGDYLETALATISERDEQIAEFDRRLTKLGGEHSYALDLIQSRDEQLQRVFDKPAIGLMFKAMWKHEQR